MDWKFWLQRRRVKLWQAVALTLGVEPDDLKRRPGLTDGRTPPFDTTRLPNIEKQRAFARALTLAVDAVDYAAGPIWPEGPTFGKDKRLCDVKLADVAVYAVACEWWSDIPDEIRRLAQAAPVVQRKAKAKPGTPASESDGERRYQMCVNAGLAMPKDDYSHLPVGVGALAREENISTAAFSKSVKKYIAERKSGKQIVNQSSTG